MKNIETLKKQGAEKALVTEIIELQHDLCSRVWVHHMAGRMFCKFNDKLAQSRNILDQMHQLFEALHELNPKHK